MCFGIIGAVVGAVGSLASGAAQASAAEYQAEVARNNAIIQNQNANYAANSGAVQAEETSKKDAAQQSAIRAAIAANGVDVDTGSASNVQTGAREIGKLDAERVENKAQLQVYGYRAAAVNDEAQAGLYDMEASNASVSSLFGAMGGLFNGLGKAGVSLGSFGGSGSVDTGGGAISNTMNDYGFSVAGA